MKPWAEMSAAGRGGVLGGVAAVVAALFYGAWTVSRPQMAEVAPGVAVTAPEGEALPEVEAEAPAEDAAEDAAETAAEEDGAETAAEAASETAAEAQEEDAAVVAPDLAPEPEIGTAAVLEVEEAAPEEAEAGPAEAVVEGAETAVAEPAPMPVAPPRFDLVRVERDGSALVAGSAIPGATLSLRVTGEEIVAVPADGQGKFVAMFNLAPSPAPRVLSLVMRTVDGREVPAEGTVVIAPTVAPVMVAAAEEPREAAMAEVGTPGVATEVASGAESDPVPEPVAELAPPAALLVTDEGARVLQSASTMSPELVANVTIDTITYTPEGAVQLAGRGTPERLVRLYLDNAPLSEAGISAAGDWAVTLPEVAPGIYTLRADQVDETGAVTSRFETPFKRETVEALAAASAGAAAGASAAEALAGVPEAEAAVTDEGEAATEAAVAEPVAPVTVTVQPGFTLWQIATEQLGAGILYVQVFEANRDQIRDPDLIYPGQVFAIPERQ